MAGRGVRVGLAAAVLREAVPVHASLVGATPTPASDAVTVTANPIGVRIINVRLSHSLSSCENHLLLFKNMSIHINLGIPA